MSYFSETMGNLLHQTAFFNLTWGNFVMIAGRMLFSCIWQSQRDLSRCFLFRSHSVCCL